MTLVRATEDNSADPKVLSDSWYSNINVNTLMHTNQGIPVQKMRPLWNAISIPKEQIILNSCDNNTATNTYIIASLITKLFPHCTKAIVLNNHEEGTVVEVHGTAIYINISRRLETIDDLRRNTPEVDIIEDYDGQCVVSLKSSGRVLYKTGQKEHLKWFLCTDIVELLWECRHLILVMMEMSIDHDCTGVINPIRINHEFCQCSWVLQQNTALPNKDEPIDIIEWFQVQALSEGHMTMDKSCKIYLQSLTRTELFERRVGHGTLKLNAPSILPLKYQLKDELQISNSTGNIQHSRLINNATLLGKPCMINLADVFNLTVPGVTKTQRRQHASDLLCEMRMGFPSNTHRIEDLSLQTVLYRPQKKPPCRGASKT
jgi:hypothetical protein